MTGKSLKILGLCWCIWYVCIQSAHCQFFVQSQDFPNSEFNYYTLGGNTVVGLAADGFVFDLLEPPDWESVHIGDELENPINGFRGRVHFLDCQPSVPVPVDTAVTMFHKYIGNDPEKWKVNQHTFTKFKYTEIYEGIDLIAKIGKNGFKYEFEVSPGADPNQIRWVYEGFDGRILPDQRVELTNPIRSFFESSPVSFVAETSGQKIPTNFTFSNDVFSLKIEEYDTSKTLIIDPEVLFCSYGLDGGFSCSAPTEDGKIITGNGTNGWNPNLLSIGSGMYSVVEGEVFSIFIECFASDGTTLEWLALIGGDGTSATYDIDVSPTGDIAVLGNTRASDFPVTSNAYDQSIDALNVRNRVIFILNSVGSELIGSTYADFDDNDNAIGGTHRMEYQPELSNFEWDEERFRIEISYDKVFVGWGRQGGTDLAETLIYGDETLDFQNMFIAQLDVELTTLNWDCAISAPANEFGSVDSFSDLEVLSNGNLAVCGWSRAPLPLVSPAFDEIFEGQEEAWIAVFDQNNGDMLHATYFGGPGEEEAWLLHSMDNELAVIGKTNNPENYGPADLSIGDESVWINVYSNDLADLHKHYRLGPETGMDEPFPISLGSDPCGNLVFGLAQENNYNDDLDNGMSGWFLSEEAFQIEGMTYFGRVNRIANSLDFTTYFGGLVIWADVRMSKVNSSGHLAHGAHVKENPQLSEMFPTPGAFMEYNPNFDHHHAVALLDLSSGQAGTLEATPSYTINGNCAPYEVELSQEGDAQEVVWQMDGDTLLNGSSGILEFSEPGTYQLEVIVRDSSYCNVEDSAMIEIVLDNPPSAFEGAWDVPEIAPCSYPQELDLAFTGIGADSFEWKLNNQVAGNAEAVTMVLEEPGNYTISLLAEDTLCEVDSVFTTTVEIFPLPTASINGTAFQPTACDSVLFEGEAIATNYDELWWNDGTGNSSNEIDFVQAYDSGNYEITLEAYSENCEHTATDTYELEVELADAKDMHLLLPNVISPQFDGQNDVFEFFPDQSELELIESFELKIFNRWGTQVYETDNPNFSWDGSLAGENVTEGVFTYTLKFSLTCSAESYQYQTGSFQLVR